ncbi:MAG: 6-bladed beta-propeller, partial [Bacteroidales bacterium]
MKRNPACNAAIMILLIIIPIIPILSQNGSMLKQWGEFGDKPGQLKFPTMIASCKNADLFVVDQHNHRIQKFDQDGNFILMWGKQGSGPGEFNFPYG